MAELREIKGIGPFYSELIVIRGTGFADVLPVSEPRALALAARLYHLPAPPDQDRFRALAEPWRPFRTWAVVLIRAATSRVIGDDAGGAARRPQPGDPPGSPATAGAPFAEAVSVRARARRKTTLQNACSQRTTRQNACPAGSV